jgi:di/tricarboxylate transporter
MFLVTSAVSQIASNSATVSMLLPVVLEIADSLQV